MPRIAAILATAAVPVALLAGCSTPSASTSSAPTTSSSAPIASAPDFRLTGPSYPVRGSVSLAVESKGKSVGLTGKQQTIDWCYVNDNTPVSPRKTPKSVAAAAAETDRDLRYFQAHTTAPHGVVPGTSLFTAALPLTGGGVVEARFVDLKINNDPSVEGFRSFRNGDDLVVSAECRTASDRDAFVKHLRVSLRPAQHAG